MRYEGSMYFTSASLKRFLISLFIQGPTSFRMGLPLRSVWTSPDIKSSCSVACIQSAEGRLRAECRGQTQGRVQRADSGQSADGRLRLH